jgi:hypothetical protein
MLNFSEIDEIRSVLAFALSRSKFSPTGCNQCAKKAQICNHQLIIRLIFSKSAKIKLNEITTNEKMLRRTPDQKSNLSKTD